MPETRTDPATDPAIAGSPSRSARSALVELCRRAAGRTMSSGIAGGSPDTYPREMLIEDAARHGVEGLVVRALCGLIAPPPRDESEAQLHHHHLSLRRRAAAFAFARDRVLDVLAAAGVHP